MQHNELLDLPDTIGMVWEDKEDADESFIAICTLKDNFWSILIVNIKRLKFNIVKVVKLLKDNILKSLFPFVGKENN